MRNIFLALFLFVGVVATAQQWRPSNANQTLISLVDTAGHQGDFLSLVGDSIALTNLKETITTLSTNNNRDSLFYTNELGITVGIPSSSSVNASEGLTSANGNVTLGGILTTNRVIETGINKISFKKDDISEEDEVEIINGNLIVDNAIGSDRSFIWNLNDRILFTTNTQKATLDFGVLTANFDATVILEFASNNSSSNNKTEGNLKISYGLRVSSSTINHQNKTILVSDVPTKALRVGDFYLDTLNRLKIDFYHVLNGSTFVGIKVNVLNATYGNTVSEISMLNISVIQPVTHTDILPPPANEQITLGTPTFSTHAAAAEDLELRDKYFIDGDNTLYALLDTTFSGNSGGSGSTELANNGLSKSANTIQLGQIIGAVGNPALLLNNTEIPMGGNSLSFNDGRVDFKTAGSNVFSVEGTTGIVNTKHTELSNTITFSKNAGMWYSDVGTGSYNQLINEKARLTWVQGFTGTIRVQIIVTNSNTLHGSCVVDYNVRTGGVATQRKIVRVFDFNNPSMNLYLTDITIDGSNNYIDIYSPNGTVIYDVNVTFLKGGGGTDIETILRSVTFTRDIVHTDVVPLRMYEQLSNSIPIYNTHLEAENDVNLPALATYFLINDHSIYKK